MLYTLGMFRKCHSLDKTKIKGKIVLCDGTGDSYSTFDKIETVKGGEGIGLIHIDDQGRSFASAYGAFPATVISSKDGDTILQYVNSTR